MKPTRTLGLTLVAVVGVMAVVGVSSAAAKAGPVELCKAANETPCAAGNLYEPTPANPLVIEQELKSPQQLLSNKESFVESCQKSTMRGKTGGEDQVQHLVINEKEVEIHQLIGTIESFTEAECTGPLGEKCTIEAIQLPWTLHLVQKLPDANGNIEENNGDMYLGEHKEGGQPGWLQKCKTIIGTVECEYKSHEEQPGHEHEWTKLQIQGGNPADDQAKAQLKLVRGSGPCGTPGKSEGLWEDAYKTVLPNGPLYITHQVI